MRPGATVVTRLPLLPAPTLPAPSARNPQAVGSGPCEGSLAAMLTAGQQVERNPGDELIPDSQEKAAGASQPASQPAAGMQPPPRSPLRRVQSSPSRAAAAAAAAEPTGSACPEAPPLSQPIAGQESRQRHSVVGKENSQPTPSEPHGAAPCSQVASDGPEQPLAGDKPPQLEAAERVPRRPHGPSQDTQPLESLSSRPSLFTPDAPVTVDAHRMQGLGPGLGGARLADPLQLSATVPALPKGLARPPDATGAQDMVAPNLVPLLAPDAATAVSVAPAEESPELAAGRGAAAPQPGSAALARQLPANVNRFYMRQAPPPGRTLAGGVTVEAFQSIEPFRWSPSPALAAAHAAAMLPALQPDPVAADANLGKAAMPVEFGLAPPDEEGDRAAAAAEAEDAVSDTQGTTPSRRVPSSADADDGEEAGTVPDPGEAAEREPTGQTQTQDEEDMEIEPPPGSPPGQDGGRRAEAEGRDSSPPSPAARAAGTQSAGNSQESPSDRSPDVGRAPGEAIIAIAAADLGQGPQACAETAVAARMELPAREEAIPQPDMADALLRRSGDALVDCPTDAEVQVRSRVFSFPKQRAIRVQLTSSH